MIKSIQGVKDKLKILAKEKNIEFNSAMRFFMYDRFIERLSKSNYKNNFILKGGFYLSTLFGIDNRSTMDIDTAITNTQFNNENILRMLNEIIQVDVSDNVTFFVEKIETIRDEDEYGGLRITLRFRLEGYNDSFHIDVATGDPIYPGPSSYDYKSLIGDEKYNLWAYSIETILAEKIETIFSKLESSSRMKDYYDIYLIYNNEFKTLSRDNFRKAIEKTFIKRNFNGNLEERLITLKNSEKLRTYWLAYTRKNKLINNISFEDTIKCLEKFINLISFVVE